MARARARKNNIIRRVILTVVSYAFLRLSRARAREKLGLTLAGTLRCVSGDSAETEFARGAGVGPVSSSRTAALLMMVPRPSFTAWSWPLRM